MFTFNITFAVFSCVIAIGIYLFHTGTARNKYLRIVDGDAVLRAIYKNSNEIDNIKVEGQGAAFANMILGILYVILEILCIALGSILEKFFDVVFSFQTSVLLAASLTLLITVICNLFKKK